LASVASIYFGWLYLLMDNLAVPIATHAVYDLITLLLAHYDVAGMTTEEQRLFARWMDPKSEDGV
jgi:membrane protease YdiL (CAAX protease family)